jgi:hypothetical protein
MSDQRNIEDLPREYHLDDGDLVIHIAPEVVETHVGQVDILVFASLGLSKYGQQEIVLCPGTRDSRIANSAIDDILKYYQTVLEVTRDGRIVDAGGYTGFEGTGPLGFAGLYYVAARVTGQFAQELDDYLVGVFVTEVELEAVMRFGPTRVSAVLGMLNQWYPIPFWTTIRRDPQLIAEINGKSILSLMPGIQLTASAAFTDNTRVTLQLSEEDREGLVEANKTLPPKTAYFLKLQMSAHADGCLYWIPGQHAASAINPHGAVGRNVNVAFLAVVPELDSDSATLVEDGFSLLLTDATTEILHDALRNNTPLSLQFLEGPITAFHLRLAP